MTGRRLPPKLTGNTQADRTNVARADDPPVFQDFGFRKRSMAAASPHRSPLPTKAVYFLLVAATIVAGSLADIPKVGVLDSLPAVILELSAPAGVG